MATNLDLIFTLTSLFSRELCLAANLNRYPANVICLFEFSPLFDPGASFFWSVCLAQIHHLPASMLSRGFILQVQAPHPVAAEPDQKRHAYGTIRKVRAWNLQRWHGRRPAHLPPASCAGPPARFPQFRYVVRLEFSGSFGPMQRGAEPRSSKAISADAAERPMDRA
jgi:hypothetical protein